MKYIKHLEDNGYVFPTNVSLKNLKYLLDVGSRPVVYLKVRYKYKSEYLYDGHYALRYDDSLNSHFSFTILIKIAKIQPASKFNIIADSMSFPFVKSEFLCQYPNYTNLFQKSVKYFYSNLRFNVAISSLTIKRVSI